MDTFLTAKEIATLLGKTVRTIQIRATKDHWPFQNGNGKGGIHRKYPIVSLPAEIQKTWVQKKDAIPILLPALAPEALLAVIDRALSIPTFTEIATKGSSANSRSSWTTKTAISESDLQDPRIRRILAILREAEELPRGWPKGRRKWIEAVAIKNDCQWQTIYRWIKKYEKRGIAGLRHAKSNAERPKAWTLEALDFWISLCLKSEHRKINRTSLYNDVLLIEAHRRGWRVGSYKSAFWWLRKRMNPLLKAMQKGGLRALDNVLPPVLRDYSDLVPFEILVGDQHRFNFWVMDEETGEVFRPEGYLWQDLRTRIIYGAALDRRYDAWLIGLSLRIGMRCYGSFQNIYTDNGRPECSRFLAQILSNIRSLGMEWERTEDFPMDIVELESEDIDPHLILPGTHRKAVVKNAKAKMIEGTFSVLENLLASHFRLPGYVKRLNESKEIQDKDRAEVMALAKKGKLLTACEFALWVYRALDHYNRERAHRGVQREWVWKPRPSRTTPFDCLCACYNDGWRPRIVSDEAADLFFLARERRTVNLGRVQLRGDFYEHELLLTMHGQKVDLRFNPMELTEVHVFWQGRYLCTAVPVEYSSMKDRDLARRKIDEKRARRKRFSDEFRRITSLTPDFREYSSVPSIERVAALIDSGRQKRAEDGRDLYKQYTPDELEAEMARRESVPPMPKRKKPLPARPSFFLDDFSRYEWCIQIVIAGGELSEEDAAWKNVYESRMSPEQLEYWKAVQEYEA